MKKDVRLYIDDIRESVKLLSKYAKGATITDISNNTMLQDSIIRRLIIIGEAVKKVPEEIRNMEPNIPWRSIAGTRDVLIHDYDAVKPELVMKILSEDIPLLSQHIEAFGERLEGINL